MADARPEAFADAAQAPDERVRALARSVPVVGLDGWAQDAPVQRERDGSAAAQDGSELERVREPEPDDLVRAGSVQDGCWVAPEPVTVVLLAGDLPEAQA